MFRALIAAGIRITPALDRRWESDSLLSQRLARANSQGGAAFSVLHESILMSVPSGVFLVGMRDRQNARSRRGQNGQRQKSLGKVVKFHTPLPSEAQANSTQGTAAPR